VVAEIFPPGCEPARQTKDSLQQQARIGRFCAIASFSCNNHQNSRRPAGEDFVLPAKSKFRHRQRGGDDVSPCRQVPGAPKISPRNNCAVVVSGVSKGRLKTIGRFSQCCFAKRVQNLGISDPHFSDSASSPTVIPSVACSARIIMRSQLSLDSYRRHIRAYITSYLFSPPCAPKCFKVRYVESTEIRLSWSNPEWCLT